MRQSEGQLLNCHKITGGAVEGKALVSRDPICFYLTDPGTGNIVEKGHSIEGKSVSGRVVVFPSGKGSSVVQVDGLYQLSQKENAPAGLIIKDIETVLVVASIMNEIPLVDSLEEDPFKEITSGDYVRINADKEIVEIK